MRMFNKNKKIIFLLLLSGLSGFIFSLYTHRNGNRMVDQSVNYATTRETFHYPALLVKQLQGDPQAGKKIFQEFCAACHAEKPLIDLPAPRINDVKAWAALKQLGIENLLKLTINGVGAMPARGGCFECSDEQLRETIHYILSVSSAFPSHSSNYQ